MKTTEILLSGDVDDPGFLDWICHRARLLDLPGSVAVAPKGVIVRVSGPKPLIDAMGMACSLGPTTVDVHGIDIRELPDECPRKDFQKLDF